MHSKETKEVITGNLAAGLTLNQDGYDKHPTMSTYKPVQGKMLEWVSRKCRRKGSKIMSM